MTSRLRRLATPLLVAALPLGGCGSSDAPAPKDAESSSTVDASPATGDEISGDGYSFRVPDGWGEPTQDMTGFDPDAFAAEKKPKDGFANNVNVILVSPAPGDDVEELEDAAEDELKAFGATDVTVGDRLTIDGEDAIQVTASQKLNATTYDTVQLFAIRGDAAYTITFSFRSDTPQDERDAVVGPVLASWAWE